jgi:hypothetical protein
MRRALVAGLAMATTLSAAAVAAPRPLTRANLRALVLHDPAVAAFNRALVRGERAGGGIAGVVFGDLTGDGRLDAVVPVLGGGQSGVVAYFVYAIVGGRVRDILAVNDTDRALVSIEAGRLVEVTPAFRRGDARCCPSVLRTTVMRWDGQQMRVRSSRRQRVL